MTRLLPCTAMVVRLLQLVRLRLAYYAFRMLIDDTDYFVGFDGIGGKVTFTFHGTGIWLVIPVNPLVAHVILKLSICSS